MNNIQHRPILNTKKVEKLYTEKDGVDVKYVCTSELPTHSNVPVDIFYRETPHPKFGNRYFGLFYRYYSDEEKPVLLITNADSVEEIEIDTLDVNDTYIYSRYRHDYYTYEDAMVDGGREYTKHSGNYPIVTMIIKDGEMVRK